MAISSEGIVLLLSEPAPAIDMMIETVPEIVATRVVGAVRSLAGGGESIGSTTPPQQSGTFGCIVKDHAGTQFALTCDHVAGDLAGQWPGSDVRAPGSAHRTPPHSRIGVYHLGSSVTLSTSAANTVDAALVKLDNPATHSKHIKGLGTPTGFGAPPALGDQLYKSGDRTGVTKGDLVYLVTLNVSYAAGTARFVDQLGIEQAGSPFAEPRDSGSAVLNNALEVVGLLFASASQSNLGFANPIDAVALTLGVDLA